MDEIIGGSGAVAEPHPSAWLGRSDRDVLASVADEPRAFGEVYRRHAGPIYRYFRARGLGAQDAFDLLAETFATALVALDDYDPARGSPDGWLFGIARNLYRQSARTERLVERTRVRYGVRAARLDPDATARIDDLVDLERCRADLEAGIRGLPPELAVAVELRYREDLRYAEIADRLGISPEAARKRVERGTSRLARAVANPFEIVER